VSILLQQAIPDNKNAEMQQLKIGDLVTKELQRKGLQTVQALQNVNPKQHHIVLGTAFQAVGQTMPEDVLVRLHSFPIVSLRNARIIMHMTTLRNANSNESQGEMCEADATGILHLAQSLECDFQCRVSALGANQKPKGSKKHPSWWAVLIAIYEPTTATLVADDIAAGLVETSLVGGVVDELGDAVPIEVKSAKFGTKRDVNNKKQFVNVQVSRSAELLALKRLGALRENQQISLRFSTPTKLGNWTFKLILLNDTILGIDKVLVVDAVNIY
jgi:hypothetical protein